MPQWDDNERKMLSDLEKELGSAELEAVLSEWVTSSVHRVFAVTVVLGCWHEQLLAQGWSAEAVEASLPMILNRLWSVPTSNKGNVVINTSLPFFEDDDDEEIEDD